MARKPIPDEIQKNILMNSKRRCCLCFYLEDNNAEQKGQIAHLDKDNTNNKENNLAFLCLKHHDAYDSRSSQSKNYTKKEVEEYRDKLHSLNDPEIYDLKYILNNTVQGGLQEYEKWVKGYKKNGGKTHHLKRERFNNIRVVKSKIFLKPFYGAMRQELIIEKGVEVEYLSENIGHSIIYFMDGYKFMGHGTPQDV